MSAAGAYTMKADASPLLLRLLVESSAAVLSALSVAPAISIVDKAIVSNASGLEPMIPSVINSVKAFLSNPFHFMSQISFLLIWGTYGGTYIVANSVTAICERAGVSALYPKLIGSSIANVGLSLYKDKAYARMYGTGKPKPVPGLSMFCFGLRDTMTILASFTLPKFISQFMQNQFNMTPKGADNLAQLVTPCAMQIFSSPLHLYGLDLYNNPVATRAERLAAIRKGYVSTSLARMARILPAFGIGGVVNTNVRAEGRAFLDKMF